MTFRSTKTYGHEVGLSACFRQWRADSHCHFLHGYALSIKLEFEATELDHRNWVVDFGGLKDLKNDLQDLFDHKTVVASDDPHLDYLKQGHELGVLDLVVVEDVGCEKFAEMTYDITDAFLRKTGMAPRCKVVSVEVREHGANSAIFQS
jgi:6-pyruvoyltetrahydropterin/6-carboxytetrahydropterin synthase